MDPEANSIPSCVYVCACVCATVGSNDPSSQRLGRLADHEATPVAARHARKGARGLFDFNSISALVPQRQLSVVVSLRLCHHHNH